MKTFLAVLAIGALLFFFWFLWDSSKPRLFARIDIDKRREAIVITNGNDATWENPKIILNDAFNGAMLEVYDAWPAGERREFSLRAFRGRLNQQEFNPKFERVREVIIFADGFQSGTYR